MYENGADVIYHAGTAGGGLFDASRVAGRWAIGVDVDQALTADPEVAGAILTSMVKRYDEVAYLAVADAVNAEMTPGSEVFGVAEGDVVWSETGGHIASIVADVEMWRDAIGTGAVTVPSVVERRALVPRGTACPAEGCIIRFITVEPSGSELQVTLEANWVLDVGAMHAHYYWSPRYTSSQVGGDSEARFGVPVGDWDLDDSYPVYVTQGSVSLAGRGDDSELCVTPADAGHNVIDPNLFDCILIGNLVG